MRTEYIGNVLEVRAVEDTIRATKKYTKGAFTRPIHHPIQGEDFPSRVLTEHYEVYPDLDISRMSLGQAWEWVTGYVDHIDVLFKYDYKNNKGIVIIRGGHTIVDQLKEGIPYFKKELEKVKQNGHR